MLELVAKVVLGAGVGYIFGAFPTGYFLGRLHGVDVRQLGSGRTGGSNVLRTIGWRAFALTVLGDTLKGIVPVLLVMHVLLPTSATAAASAVVGVLVGSNWSIIIAWLAHNDVVNGSPSSPVEAAKGLFARAKGGAGVMATAGAALTLYWPPVPPLTVIGLLVLIIIGYSSLASMTVAALYPLVMAFFVVTAQAPIIYFLMSTIVAAIVLYVLTPNMRRLKEGTEKKFGQRLTTE